MKEKENLLNNADEKSLTHSFYDACSDKEFRKYLDTLKIEDEILMKYTSSLEDSFIEYKNCSNCKNLAACQNQVPGYLRYYRRDHVEAGVYYGTHFRGTL